MEHLKKYGHPDSLLDAENRIILKMVSSQWPQDKHLPDGFSLGSIEGGDQVLVTRKEPFVAAKDSLKNIKVSAALFAGCAAFRTSDFFELAARQVLAEADEICIVHNKDTVYKLIRMFPRARVLALPHDLGTHALDVDEPRRDNSSPLFPFYEYSRLRQLVGCVEGQDFLHFTRETVSAILKTCHLLKRIDTPIVFEPLMEPHQPSEPRGCAKAADFTHVTLLTSFQIGTRGLGVLAREEDIWRAATMFSGVEHLAVTVTSRGSMTAASAFPNIHSFSLTLADAMTLADVDFELQALLRSFPLLETLSMKFCGGVRLTTMASLCPQIKSLRLVNCQRSEQDPAVPIDAFPELESLELSTDLQKIVFESLFVATCERLHSLRFGGDENCKLFLYICCDPCRKISFPRLEDLTLTTGCTVPELGLQPEDFHVVLKALPALRRLETDSYDLRIFFENYCRPPGSVSLSWCECVYCAVHDQHRVKRQDFATKFILPFQECSWSNQS